MKSLSILTLLALLASTPAVAAQTTAGGSIRGRVRDGAGAAITGAAVTATSPNIAGTFTATTDDAGDYRFLDLPPDPGYTIRVTMEGFAPLTRSGIIVRAGLNNTLDLELNIGTVDQAVEISGKTPLIDTVSAEQAVNISGDLVRNLPLTGRREWSDTLQLAPGILSASTDAYGGQVYFVRGTENENHATLLDGADLGSFAQNWPSNFISISTESLGDIQVKTGAIDASSPSAMGMVINMATPTGGNQFHGVASLLYSPRKLNDNNTPGGDSALSEAVQPDFSLSGPIKKDRIWFFASGRYINRNDGISRTATQLANLRAVDPAFEPFDNEARGFVYLVNGTAQLTDRHRLFGLVQYDSRTQGGNFQQYAGNYAPNQYGGGAYAVRLSSFWSPRLTTRFLIAHNTKGSNDNLDVIGGLGTAPEVDVYTAVNRSGGRLVGTGNVATLNNLGSRSTNPAHKSTISGDISYYLPEKAGSHELQTGFYLQPRAAAKSTTYYANNGFTLEDVVLRDPANPAGGSIPFHRRYQDAGSAGIVTSYIGADDYALYLQDRWRVTQRLTLTLGFRADWVASRDLLFQIDTSKAWNYAPRAAGAFVLTKNLKNVVRASWGRVTDIPNASYLGTAGTSVSGLRDEYDLDLNGSFETVFITPGGTTLAANRSFDPKRHQGFVDEWILGYRTELPGSFSFDVSYIDRAYKDRPAQVEINQIYNGNVWAGLVDPTQNSILLVTNNRWNWFVYRGLEFTATKQTSKFQFISTYTRAWDHIAGTWQPNDPASFIQPNAFANDAGIGTVRGNTTNSLGGDTRNRMWQKHQFRTGVTWSAPWRLRFSHTFTAQSGTPTGPITTNIDAPDPQFGPTTLTINGRLVSNPLATTTRFYYETRGAWQLWTPWLIAWNARVGREIALSEHSSLEIVADFFNITNRGAAQQFVTGGNQINSTNYSGLQNIQTPRSAQFSVRWKF
jgi:carboxypeptidase family protein/TonB-dependent receptor-like protein